MNYETLGENQREGDNSNLEAIEVCTSEMSSLSRLAREKNAERDVLMADLFERFGALESLILELQKSY